MSSNEPPGGDGPPRPSRRGGRNPAGQPPPATQPTGYESYPPTGQQQGTSYGGPYGGPYGGGAPAPPSHAGAFAASQPGEYAAPRTPSGGSFQFQPSFHGPQSAISTGSQHSQHSPLGTPWQGSQITASDLQSRGSGGTKFFGKDKAGQYLEDLYPSAFLEILRKHNVIHLQEPYQLYYKYQSDPAPPSVDDWALMIKKIDRLARKIFFVHGTAKYAPAAIKLLFPGLDTRTTTFQKLYIEYTTNTAQNLRRRIMWEDMFLLCLEWSRDFPDEFRVDPDRYPAGNRADLDYTRHWIYNQINEGTYKRGWSAVYDVIPWAGNFDDANSLQFWFLKTITAAVMQKIGPIAAMEQKMNPGVKWARRGVKWVMATDERKAAYDFLELQGTDSRFKHVELDTFVYNQFQDENTSSTPTLAPKRRAEDLRAQNAFVSESPPPSPPHKTPRRESSDIFATPGQRHRADVFSSASRPRHMSPFNQGMPGPSTSTAQGQAGIDPRLSSFNPQDYGRGPSDTRSGSTPRAAGAAGGYLSYESSYESPNVRAARLELEQRDALQRRKAEIEQENKQRMEQELARMQQTFERERSSQRPYQQPPSQASRHSGDPRSPSLPPIIGGPPPPPRGIHHSSQGPGRSRPPSDADSQLSRTSDAMSNLQIQEGRPQSSGQGDRPRSSGRGDSGARGDLGGPGGSGGRGSSGNRGGSGSRGSASRPQLGSGLSTMSQRPSAYPLTPLQMQQAAAGVYSGTQGESSGLPASRRTSSGTSFMAPTASSITRSNSTRQLRPPSSAAGPSTSLRRSTRVQRPGLTLQQEQEAQRQREDRQRRRQAGERVDSPEPEIGRGHFTRSVSRSQTMTQETVRSGTLSHSRSQVFNTQETETMRGDSNPSDVDGDLVDDLDDNRERTQSPSVQAANFLSLHRASYK